MNCIPSPRLLVLCAACLGACGVPASEPEPGSRQYGLAYLVTPSPAEQSVAVQLSVAQDDDLLREMRFDADPERYSDFEADGELAIDGARITWSPPQDGGVLRWRVSVPRRRNSNGYDAWLDKSWGLFRAEDIIPRSATRTLMGVSSATSIEFQLPTHWSAVTEYSGAGGVFRVRKANRRFSQPSGWIVIGELGVRRERIAGVRVAIAAPEDQGVRRLDMLALLNWTLPELARILPQLPPRLTVVSAGSPLWHGALSAPQSIYIHASRPLISENGTSTLLHEVVHVALGGGAGIDVDWLAEGLAEYYSLQLLRRSGSLTAKRYQRAMERQKECGESADSLCGDSSTGATTALAVTVLATLDQEIRTNSDDDASLDDVLQQMLRSNTPLSLESLTETAAGLLGKKPDALHIDKLPGCRKLSTSEAEST